MAGVSARKYGRMAIPLWSDGLRAAPQEISDWAALSEECFTVCLKEVMNWTTTQVPMWQVDCENYRKTGTPFKVRDVSRREHFAFVQMFASTHGLEYEFNGSTVFFTRTDRDRIAPRRNSGASALDSRESEPVRN